MRSGARAGGKAARYIGSTAWRIAKPSIAIAIFLGIWEAAPRLGLVDKVFLPPFTEVVSAFLHPRRERTIARACFGQSDACADRASSWLSRSRFRWELRSPGTARSPDFLNPILELFRNTAALALLPVFVLILGIGEESKIALVIYACTFPILLNTISGVRTVDPLLIKSAASLGFSSIRLFQKVVLPAAVPTIFNGYPHGSRVVDSRADRRRNGRGQSRSRVSDHRFTTQLPDPEHVRRASSRSRCWV